MTPIARAAVILAIVMGATPASTASGEGHAVRVEHRPSAEAPTIGPPDAPVTFELFFTPGAPPSHDAYRSLIELQRRHPTRLRAVFRPLHRTHNIPDMLMAAHRRGRFFELMSLMTAPGPGPGAPSAAQTVELAVKLGLPRSAIERAHLDDAVDAALEANHHRAFRLGTTYNPELVINGVPMGRRTADRATIGELEREYQAAYEEARRAESQGMEPGALVGWGNQREACGDNDVEEEPEDPRDSPDGNAPETAGGGDLTAAPEPPRKAPSYTARLGRLLLRGTGCKVAPHMPATLDEGASFTLPNADPAPLLAAPLATTGLPAFGPSDAQVVIYAVCNLRGRFCLDQVDLARRVAEHYPGKVRVVWVPWVDLALESSDKDLVLAQAALCAARGGDADGWAFLRAVAGTNVPARGRIDVAVIAATAELDVDRVVTCAGGEPADARAAVEGARAAGIGWGPTLVIGGRAYLGGFSDDRRAAQRVAAELAPGLLEALVPTTGP
jgi:hypothetical protein